MGNTHQLPYNYDFEQIVIDKWRPDNTPIEVTVRSFRKVLRSLHGKGHLFKESNLSLPNSESPYSYENSPPVETISELHHGSWWAETWKDTCKSPKEMLVPLILYMDAIAIDRHGKLSLTPLNFTLGIFSTSTRKQSDAWETFYFHPDSPYIAKSTSQTESIKPIHNVENLHNGLRTALQSIKEEVDAETGLLCTNFPWNDKKWDVKMRFAIAFVIGDTDLHDKLCCHYGGRNEGTKVICCHCNCVTSDLSIPAKQKTTQLWVPDDFSEEKFSKEEEDWSKKCSHHPVNNAFHELNFGANIHNIHLASPGECLHMHQLGVSKRCIESFEFFLRKFKQIEGRKHHPNIIHNKISQLARDYGGLLSRQSERNLPRTRLTTDFLSTTMKEGKDYVGMILCLVIACLSRKGKRLLTQHHNIPLDKLRKLVETLELVLFMEEFLVHCNLRKEHIGSLSMLIDKFIIDINNNCKRGTGMEGKLIKYHLYFHLPKYIELWGPPSGWDSSSSEAHHKKQIKMPALNTQQTARTFIEQTSKRHMEQKYIEQVTRYMPISCGSRSREVKQIAGARFTITMCNHSNLVEMEWTHKRNQDKAHLPQSVLDYCATEFLSGETTTIEGFTEHNRVCEDHVYKFRAHPSYRANSGQKTDVWFDWACFKFIGDDGVEKVAPAQILCFLFPGAEHGNNYREHEPYAIVRSFNSPPKKHTSSSIVYVGKLEETFFPYPCSCITGPCAVVPNFDDEDVNETHDRFFLIQNRSHWLKQFHKQIEEIR